MKRISSLLGALVLVVAACGDSDSGDTVPTTAPSEVAEAEPTTTTTTTAAATTTTTSAAVAPSGAEVAVASSELGDILVDGDGRTLYLFTVDTQNGDTSACTGDCLATWPALAGEATAGDGVDAALLGTVTRDDGSTQATYNGWPLYYFAADAAAGDINGQAVGDVWWVVDPAGNAIQ